jgi:hypothetical protein
MDIADTLTLERAQRLPQLLNLAPDHVRTEVSAGTSLVSLLADALRQVENDSDDKDVVLACKGDEWLPRLRLDIGRVDDRHAGVREPRARDKAKGFERLGCGGLVVLVVGDEAAEIVGRQHLSGQKVLRGKGRLAGAGGTDQQNEGAVGDR